MQTYPRNLKSLALLAVLVLCLFAFTLVSIGEAEAEESLSQMPQRPMAKGAMEHSVIPDGKGADQVAVETSLVETASVGSTMTEASPPDQLLSSPVGLDAGGAEPEPAPPLYAVVIRNGEIVESDPDLAQEPQKAQPAPTTAKLSDRPSPGKQAEVEPKPVPTPGSVAPEPHRGASEMEILASLISGHVPPPVPFVSEGEGVPTGSPTPYSLEDSPYTGTTSPSPTVLVESVEQQAPSAVDLVAGPAPSRTPDETISPPAQQVAQQALPVSWTVETASSGAVQATLKQTLTTVTDAAAGVLETLGSWTDYYYYYSPSGDTTETPSEGTAPELLASQVPSPFEGSSVFSSSGVSGQTGPWGSFVVLLLGVLVSGLVLLLRDGFLCWAACEEQPKPSSALLLPLERPG